MKLSQVIEPLKNNYSIRPEVYDINHLNINGIRYDSRFVEPGDMFVCVVGFKTDGHLFAEMAVKNGAVALLVEKYIDNIDVVQVKVSDTREAMAKLAAHFYNYPTKKLGLIGVTGTNGKTTTTYLIKSILEENHKVGLIGTIGNMIENELLPASRTTPESVDLQNLFQKMVNRKVDYGIMEVSSHALELKRVLGVSYDVAVYTNLSQDHLDFHDSIEDYKRAKGMLFAMVGRDKKDRPQYSVINADDSYYEYFRNMSNTRVISYGIKNECDFRAKNINVRGDGVSFQVVYPGGKIELNLQLTGLFNVYNSLAAFAVGYLEGIEPTQIRKNLEKVKGVPGRFERVDLNQNFTVIVDYAHTPDSLVNVLSSAKKIVQGRVIAVFGCGGDRDRTKRPVMGEAVGNNSDYAIVTSDNPRSEDPEAIIKDILPGLDKTNVPYEVVVDRKEAIGKAIQMANKDDLVLIAGKGHETYQEIKGKTYPFDDRLVAKEFLEKLV